MKTIKNWSGMDFTRFLFAAAIVFVAVFLYRRFVLPLFPGLDTGIIRTLVVGVVGAAAWWIVSRGESTQ